MIKVKLGTKKAENLLARASINEGTELWHVYDNYSTAKAVSFNQCKKWCQETNGYNFHICSHNTFSYCVAWDYMDPETGAVYTRLETPNYTYIIG